MSLEYGKDLSQLMEELSGEKLEQEPPRTVLEKEEIEDESGDAASDDVEEVDAEEVGEEGDEQPNIKDVAGLPELIVGIIDIFAATVAEAWTKTEDKSKYRLEEDEKEELVRAWGMYLKNSPDVKISPSTMLLLTTAIIYTPKFVMAIGERKEKREEARQARQMQQTQSNERANS